MRVRIPNPDCHSCDGTGMIPDSYMGSGDTYPCWCFKLADVVPIEERDRIQRAFNRLEKAVTNHLKTCWDADELAHAHKAIMRDLTEKEEANG